MTAVAVIAKECVPGRVKTRLQPEFTAEEAALIAAAALADTLRVVSHLPASRRILYWAGTQVPDEAREWEVRHQSTGGLDERIADLFDAIDQPLLLLGMDTPQVDASWLQGIFRPWGDVDAWFGPATDGGFWALALRKPDGALIRGIEMSSARTGRLQLERLTRAGLRVEELPPLTDIDTAGDVPAAAQGAPSLAETLRLLRPDDVTV